MKQFFSSRKYAEARLFLLLMAGSLAILFNHFYHVTYSDLSQWKGGGMGMFSTQDAPGTRVVSIMLETPEQQFLANSQALGRPLAHFNAMPTIENLLSLCHYAANKVWLPSGTVRTVTLNDQTLRSYAVAGLSGDKTSSHQPLAVTGLQLVTWKTLLDVPTGALTRTPLGSAYWNNAEGCRVKH
jgi:hypothetical protein